MLSEVPQSIPIPFQETIQTNPLKTCGRVRLPVEEYFRLRHLTLTSHFASTVLQCSIYLLVSESWSPDTIGDVQRILVSLVLLSTASTARLIRYSDAGWKWVLFQSGLASAQLHVHIFFMVRWTLSSWISQVDIGIDAQSIIEAPNVHHVTVVIIHPIHFSQFCQQPLVTLVCFLSGNKFSRKRIIVW